MTYKLFFPILLTIAIIRIIYTGHTFQEGEIVTVERVVDREPYIGESYQLVNLGDLSMFLPRYPEITYGDKLTVRGKYRNGMLNYPEIVNIKTGSLLFSNQRREIVEFIKKTLPEPHSSLIAGVTLGSKSGLPSDFSQMIRYTGVAHVVVASGMNVSLIAGTVLGILLYFMPRRKAIKVLYLFILGYITLSGFDPPIIRAGIMALIVYLGQLLGRVVSPVRVLLITILIMIIIFPHWISDIGFLLSFVATLSLLIFEKSVRRKLKAVPGLFRESLSTTLAAQIGVTPILYVTFGTINILSPIINALVLWTIPFITILGMVTALTIYIVPGVSRLVLYLAYPLTLWFIEIVKVFAK